MDTNPSVIISAFGDEAANRRTPHEQLSTLAGLGLEFYSLRFMNFGDGVEHIMGAAPWKVAQLVALNPEFGMNVAEIGTAIGKWKVVDEEDGTKNAYLSPEARLKQTDRAIELCGIFDTRMIRGFSFYHPKGKRAADYITHAVDALGPIGDKCRNAKVVFGMEIEANLIGEAGETLAEIHRQLNNEFVVTVWDGANVACRNIEAAGCLAQYEAMADSVGWAHVKDYLIDQGLAWTGHVDEARLKNFVPVDQGNSGYREVFGAMRRRFAAMADLTKKLGLPGVVLTLEPHLKGGGQFGGFSGPDGMGVALRALCKLLDAVEFSYSLRTMDHIRAIRAT